MDTSPKKPEQPDTLITDHPIASRETIRTIVEQAGRLVKIEGSNFAIKTSQDADALLFPVNLPDSFFEEGVDIEFSGQLKPAGNTEFWAGQPILLTSIRKK